MAGGCNCMYGPHDPRCCVKRYKQWQWQWQEVSYEWQPLLTTLYPLKPDAEPLKIKFRVVRGDDDMRC